MLEKALRKSKLGLSILKNESFWRNFLRELTIIYIYTHYYFFWGFNFNMWMLTGKFDFRIVLKDIPIFMFLSFRSKVLK